MKGFKYLENYLTTLRIVRDALCAYQKDLNDREALKRVVLWMGRELLYQHKHLDSFTEEDTYNTSLFYRTFCGKLTYKEFIEVYPINKTYDGAKYGVKDYFSTMEYLATVNLEDEIGSKENVLKLIWEYDNTELMLLGVAILTAMGDMSKKMTGVDPNEVIINKEETYAHDSKGNIIGVTSDGKVHHVPSFWNEDKKQQPFLRVVK